MNWVSIITGCGNEHKRIDAYPFRRDEFALPYLAVCAVLAAGEALGFAVAPASAWWPLAAVIFVSWVLIGYGWSIPYWNWMSVLLLGFFLAMYSESRRAAVFDGCDYSSSPFVGEFPVNGNVKASGSYLSFDSKIDGVEIRLMIPNIDGSSPTDGLPAVGEIWRCAGWLERKPRDDRQRRVLWCCGRGSGVRRVADASTNYAKSKLNRLRERLSANIGYGLSHNPLAADIDRAIILGARADLPQATRQMFADAGTVHVFAISGLHVGVIAWLLVYVLMMVFCFPLRWIAVPLIPLLIGYVLMIDAPPSAVRAAVMSIVYFVSPLFLRRSDSLVAWAVTFLVFHVLNPEMLMNVGSLLSFTVMLGILLYIRWARVFRRDWLVASGVSVAAWISGFAIVARVFARVTVGGLFANIAVVPLASLVVIFGFLGSIIGCVCPWLAAHFNNAAVLLIEAMSGISWLCSELPYGNFVVTPWPMWMCFAWYAALVLTFWLIRSVYLRRRQLF